MRDDVMLTHEVKRSLVGVVGTLTADFGPIAIGGSWCSN